ncbi:MAG: protein arginine kinase [Thermoguttaceae bacterium]
MNLKIEKMLSQLGQWLKGDGPENDIVISSRIRLARNLSGFPFLVRSSEQDRVLVRDSVKNILPEIFNDDEIYYVDLQDIPQIDRAFLLERQLISKEIVESNGPRAAVCDKDERFSIMVNEEDHIRLQSVTSGFDPEKVWNCINELDNKLESRLNYAYSEKLGYLTACPTNVGTGMRVSVMLHIPALVASKEIEKVFRSLQKVNLAVRGMYGEGSQALGDFFQISNQITLGKTEEELISKVADIVPQIISYERQARDFLRKEKLDNVIDRSSRAIGVLSTARTISSEEAMDHLSSIRLGVNMELIDGPSIETVNDLLLHIQPAHLQKLVGTLLGSNDRDLARAQYLRKRLSEKTVSEG